MPIALELVSAPPELVAKPEQVVLWYHLRIYMRVFRAFVARDRTRTEDAIGSAKLALVSIARSREALRSIGAGFDAAEVGGLVVMLDDLEHGLDEAFPEARAFVRLGLDVPVS